MHSYSTDRQRLPSTAVRIARRLLFPGICAFLAITGCTQHADELELNPRAWAPPAVEREWSPAPGSPAKVGSAAEVAALSDMPSSDRSRPLGLTELINFALARNPATR